MTMSDNKWSFQLFSPFFRINKEPTTKHPKKKSLNLEKDLEEEDIIIAIKRVETVFLFVMYTTLKFYENSMTQT